MSFLKIILPLVVIGIGLILYFIAPKLIIHTRTAAAYQNIPESGEPYKTVSIPTRDGIHLHGRWVETDSVYQGTIIFLHGIRGSAVPFIGMMQWLKSQGYNSLAIDLRAHGKSGGEYCTFGHYEKHDVQDILDFLLEKYPNETKIGVCGQSLGGAIALQAMAIEPCIKFGIVESTFGSLEQIVQDYGNRMLPIDMNWLHRFLLSRAGNIANFRPQEVKPAESAKHITQPILIAHGTADKRIKVEYGKEIFDNVASETKYFLPINGASHVDVWSKGGMEYITEVSKFLNSQQ